MNQSLRPDLFTNVHKGLRRALFAACVSLGRASGDAERERTARSTLDEALRFVAHHGENEDLLLVPLLAERAPDVAARMGAEHASLDEARRALSGELSFGPLYLAACAFTSRYLAHMDEEERELEPRIRAVLSFDEQAGFGRRSVERTAPADQRMMLKWMLPSMDEGDVEAFLGRLPASLAAELRPLALAGE